MSTHSRVLSQQFKAKGASTSIPLDEQKKIDQRALNDTNIEPVIEDFKPLAPKKKAVCHARGEVIQSDTDKYVVQIILGKGGFGTVYKVQSKKTGKSYALKTEQNEIEKRMKRLKVEAVILNTMGIRKCTNFIRLVDKGAADSYKFMVMPLVGRSIEGIKKQIMKTDNFSCSTVIKVAIQTLSAIRDLHRAGFIHRDIKPANFAVGIEDQETVFMLDFGIAKYIMDERGCPKRPREMVPFVGTVRYCSRLSHNCKEASRRDDLEAWIYMLVEMLDDKLLPWADVSDKREIPIQKDNLLKGVCPEVEEIMPAGLQTVMHYVDRLDFYDHPSYEYLMEELKATVHEKEFKIDLNEKMDWTKKEGSLKHKKQEGDPTTNASVYYGYGVQ